MDEKDAGAMEMSEQNREVGKGLIHIYYGDGKGKTTAAVGLACRAAGRGRKVIFGQFMKGSETGEIAALGKLDVEIIRAPESRGFLFNMDEEQRAEYGKFQRELYDDILNAVAASTDGDAYALVVLDEVLDILSAGFISEEDIRKLISTKSAETELVLTGRAAPEWLENQADYITEMKKIKHPWDEGIAAREGVEY